MKRQNNTFIYLCVILITLILLSMLSIYASATFKSSGLQKSISAKSAVLYEPTNNEFLYVKNGDQRLPMASTTKIMTAIVASKSCDMNDTVIIGPESVGIEGSSAYLREGDEYTVMELLYALMLQSANDAAVTLAYYIAGDLDSFAEMMNQEAAALGLKNTHFTNPHGLYDDDHYTTAKDLAIIGAELMKNDILRQVVATHKKTFTYGDRCRTYINHNKLLTMYDGAIGIKTGYTKKSGRCLVGAAEQDGVVLISVTLDAPSDWHDHMALFDYGFESLERFQLCSEGDYKKQIPVLGGKTEYVSVSAKENRWIIKEKENNAINEQINVPHYLIAPIKKGDTVGSVVYRVGDKIYTVDLIADEAVSSNLKDNSIFTKVLKKIFR